MSTVFPVVKMSVPLRSAKSMVSTAKSPQVLLPLTAISKRTGPMSLSSRQGGIPEVPFRTPQEFPTVPSYQPLVPSAPPEVPRPTRTPEMDPAGDTPPEFPPDPPAPEIVPLGPDFPSPPLNPPHDPDIPVPPPPQQPPDVVPPRPPDVDPPPSMPPDVVPPPSMPPDGPTIVYWEGKVMV